jgi:alpha-beta hydrolase superfamily lysophospholipase
MGILKTLRFLIIILLGLLLIVYFSVISYIYFNQAGMVFQNSRLSENFKFEYQQNFEELNIRSFDGVNLNGLLFKADTPKGLIFYLHGNAGTLGTWGSIADVYTSLGYDIFILDYRSFGKSGGEIESEEQLNKDISIVYKKICERYSEDKIIITGYSIGSGLATILASNNMPKALILQAPYYSFTELTSSKVPFFPDFMKRFNFETHNYVAKIKVPVYIFHGDQDQLIPFTNAIRLSELVKSDKHLYILKEQNHIGINENEDFQNQLKIILQK